MNTRTDNVFYKLDDMTIIDFIMSDGKSEIMHETAEELEKRYGTVGIGDFYTVHNAKEEMFLTAPAEITADKFQEMLEVLPPMKWIREGDAESFKLSELTYGNITAIFARIGDKYYALQDKVTLPHHEIISRCMAA